MFRRIALVGFCFGLITTALAEPTKFKSVEAMMSKFNDYVEESGTFKVLKKKPLHIQLSPVDAKGTGEDVIRENVKRAMLYGIYRTFIHTDQKKITITVVPKEIIFNSDKITYWPKYKTTLTLTKAGALKAVRKFLPIGSLDELVTTKEIAGMKISDEWVDSFHNCYWSTTKAPTLPVFYAEVVKNAETR